MVRKGGRGPFAKYKRTKCHWEENEDTEDENSPRVFFIVYLFRCPGNHLNREWESGLKGAEDGVKCTNAACKDRQPVMPCSKTKSSTPRAFFPNRRYFGHYSCHSCKRHWCSAWSWPGKYQQCNSCDIDTYPFIMRILKRGRGDGDNENEERQGNHQTDLCGKCHELGTNCATRRNILAGLNMLAIK